MVHDYGFAEPTRRRDYNPGPPSLPGFVELEFPPGSDAASRAASSASSATRHAVVQITNDVNFAELASVLGATGDVLVLPHGGQLVTSGGPLERGGGVFLTEFGPLEPSDDLPAALETLRAGQAEARDRYSREHVNGHRSLFMDSSTSSAERRGRQVTAPRDTSRRPRASGARRCRP